MKLLTIALILGLLVLTACAGDYTIEDAVRDNPKFNKEIIDDCRADNCEIVWRNDTLNDGTTLRSAMCICYG
jgi:hypothetical protein